MDPFSTNEAIEQTAVASTVGSSDFVVTSFDMDTHANSSRFHCAWLAIGVPLIAISSFADPFPAQVDVAALDPANGGDGSAGIVFTRNLAGNQSVPTQLGYAVGAAGDMNGDGARDLIIGTGPSGFNTGDPTVYVVYGGTFAGVAERLLDDLLSPVNTANWGFAFSQISAAVPITTQNVVVHSTRVQGDFDWDGDGLSDIVTKTFNDDSFTNGSDSGFAVIHGAQDFDPANANVFRMSNYPFVPFPGRFAVAQDFVGDGVASVLTLPGGTSKPCEGPSFKAVSNPADFSFSARSETGGDCPGGPLALASGDINDDGRDDVIFGGEFAPLFNIPTTFYVVFGRDWSQLSPDSYLLVGRTEMFEEGNDLGVPLINSGFHSADASIHGDINGDGNNDVLLVDRAQSSPTVGHIVFGRDDAYPIPFDLGGLPDSDARDGFVLTQNTTDTPSSCFPCEATKAAVVGDINGDGADDLFFHLRRLGRNFILYGRSTGFPAQVNLENLLNEPNPALGFEVVIDQETRLVPSDQKLGDLNGDGIDDLLLGAPTADLNGMDEVGRVYLFYGRRAVDTDGDGLPDSYELANGMDPQDPADALADFDGDGHSNIAEYQLGTSIRVDDLPPTVTAPPDIELVSTGVLTSVALGAAQAVDGLDGEVPVEPSTTGPFPTGPNNVTWTAVDAAGNVGTDSQSIDITPLVSFSESQSIREGESTMILARLNGPPVAYPVIIPFSRSGSASPYEDFQMWEGRLQIEEGLTAERSVTTVADETLEGRETIVVTMGDPINAVAGAQSVHTITLLEENFAPLVELAIEQNDRPMTTLAANGPPVTIRLAVTDPNPDDVHQYDWSGTSMALPVPVTNDISEFTIEPALLSPQLYPVRVEVADDGEPGRSVTIETLLRIVPSLPTLSNTQDSDGDGVTDADEGAGDSDGDRIQDYLDATPAANELPVANRAASLTVAPGLQLRLGTTAFASGATTAVVSYDDVALFGGFNGLPAANADDPQFTFPQGLFDFEIVGFLAGAAVTVVIPLLEAVADDAQYRKHSLASGWSTFVIDADNQLFTAPDQTGSCPPPHDSAYVPGLGVGDRCLQLVILDGGPNDADDEANGQIADPGGIAISVPSPPPPPPPVVSSGGGGGGSMGATLVLLGITFMRRRWHVGQLAQAPAS